MHQNHFRADSKHSPVRLLEGGTGYNRIFTAFDRRTYGISDCREPRETILIIERLAPSQFLDISLRMKIVALVKLPLQLTGEQLSYGGFAGPGYTRDHDYHLDSIVASAAGPKQSEGAVTSLLLDRLAKSTFLIGFMEGYAVQRQGD